jgi:2-polyprenyl-3-methyl-5-hydroxy-6-metoxy-1,4-benzoquinol methylase
MLISWFLYEPYGMMPHRSASAKEPLRWHKEQMVAQVFQNGRQLLRNYAQRLKQKSSARNRLARELQQEREKRRRAESELRRVRKLVSPAVEGQAPAVARRPDPLSEPDESVSRVRTFLSLISPLKPGKMLDLGAGPGTFSLAAASLGWQVTAVDARTVRTPDPEARHNLKRAELIRSIKWVQSDIREFPIRDGEFDLICIFGLMHHLEMKDQVKLLERCSGTYTLATVRVAPEAVATEGPYEGMYRHERGETREERDQIPQASWGNEVDFWHTEESLMRMMRDCGYGKVMTMRPPHRPYYTFYLCLPPPGPQPRALSR